MGIAQIALDPVLPASVCQMGNVEHFFQALFPSSVFWREIAYLDIEKKWSKPSMQAFTPPPLHMEATHFKKGLT